MRAFTRLEIAVAVAFTAIATAVACVGSDPTATPNVSDAGQSDGASSGPSGDAGVDGFVPASCSSGEVRCEAAQLEICNAGGTGYVITKVCDTPELCQARSGEDCAPAACA